MHLIKTLKPPGKQVIIFKGGVGKRKTSQVVLTQNNTPRVSGNEFSVEVGD